MSEDKSVLLDVYQRLGGIEAKIDDVKSIRVIADNAQATASRAEHKSDTNAKDIEDIRDEITETRKEASAHKRWLVGTALGTAVSVIGLIISILN